MTVKSLRTAVERMKESLLARPVDCVCVLVFTEAGRASTPDEVEQLARNAACRARVDHHRMGYSAVEVAPLARDEFSELSER